MKFVQLVIVIIVLPRCGWLSSSLMVSIGNGGARPCQLLACTYFNVTTQHLMAHLLREQVCLQNELNAHSGWDKASTGLSMAHSALNSNVRTPSSSLCMPFAGVPCSRMVFGTRCSLPLALDFEIGSPSSPPQPCSLKLDQAPSVLSHPPVKESHFFEHPLHSLAMVQHCMRSHHGGSRGARAHSQAPQSVEQPPLPACPPSSHANSPSFSLSRRPFLQNAFQSTHFKFLSNLNRPIIMANITIIFSEEEA